MPDHPHNLNRTALLAALHPEPESFCSMLREHPERLDWEWLIERAQAHKVAALLASRVLAAGCDARVPSAVLTRLAVARAEAVARNAAALDTLRRAARHLDDAGISFMVVKGSVLTEQVYDDAGQRWFFDLDLVVPAEKIDAAETILYGLGYRLWGADRFLGITPANAAELALSSALLRQSSKRFSRELSLVHDDATLLPIDLHWHLAPRGRLRATAEELWSYTTTARVGETTVRVLEPEAALVHLAVHALSNRPWSFRLLHLCDVAWALHRLPLDPDRVEAVARRWGAGADLARAALAVQQGLQVSLPAQWRPDVGAIPRQRYLYRMAAPEALVERRARTAPTGWARWQEEIHWSLAMGSLRSTAILLFGKYTSVIRFLVRRILRSGKLR